MSSIRARKAGVYIGTNSGLRMFSIRAGRQASIHTAHRHNFSRLCVQYYSQKEASIYIQAKKIAPLCPVLKAEEHTSVSSVLLAVGWRPYAQ